MITVLAFLWPEPTPTGLFIVDFFVVIRREAKVYVENRLFDFRQYTIRLSPILKAFASEK
jgi:uncharacterized membrane protein YfbV (UPF0208 family)